MKNIITSICILAFSLSGIAQETEKGDKKSNAILEVLTAKTEAYKSISVEFIYKMENIEADIDESTNGVLLVMGDMYKLSISGQQVFCNGEILWTYIEDAEEVQVNSLEESEQSISPNKLLTSYNKDYRSKFIGEEFLYGTTVNVIDLTPNEGKSYDRVRLIIDKKKDQLLEFSIFDKNGSAYSYVITKFVPNVDVTEAMFTFNPEDYPGVEVIDMR